MYFFVKQNNHSGEAESKVAKRAQTKALKISSSFYGTMMISSLSLIINSDSD